MFLKVSSLLEKIVETFEILEDEGLLKSIREAKEDVKVGRVTAYYELKV